MHHVIKVGFDQSNTPCTYVENGEAVGLEARYVKKILKQAGLSYRLVPLDWPEMFPSLLNEEVDVIFSSISMTSARKDSFIATRPYFNTPETMVLARKDVNREQTYGALEGTNHERYLRANVGDGAIRTYSSYSDLVQEMKQGGLDGCLVDWFNGNELIEILSNHGIQFSHENIVEPEWFGEGSCILACQRSSLIVAALDTAIKAIGPIEASLATLGSPYPHYFLE